MNDEFVDIFGANVAPSLDIDQIENEHQTLISILIDKSGSMSPYQSAMVDCIRRFKAALKNSKQEDEILVSITSFAGTVDSGGFQLIDDVSEAYSPNGSTALYDAVVVAQRQLFDGKGGGYQEKLQANGIRTKGVLVIFSDGADNDSKVYVNDAKDAIAQLLGQEMVVSFVAFGDPAKGIAQALGVPPQNVLEVSASESELRRVFDVLSKSAISASKSTASGTTQNNFFV